MQWYIVFNRFMSFTRLITQQAGIRFGYLPFLFLCASRHRFCVYLSFLRVHRHSEKDDTQGANRSRIAGIPLRHSLSIKRVQKMKKVSRLRHTALDFQDVLVHLFGYIWRANSRFTRKVSLMLRLRNDNFRIQRVLRYYYST